MTPDAKKRRLKYKRKRAMDPNLRRKEKVARKKYYSKHKSALKQKSKNTRRARKNQTLHYVKVKPLIRT
jgi:hypothetical protein